MSYSTSTILRYTNALITQLQAVLPQGTVVIDGPPPASYLQVGTLVWLGNVEGNQSYRALGNANRPRQEEFTLTCHISIYGATTVSAQNTHTLQSNTAFELLALIEQLLRSNPTLGMDAITPSDAAGGYVIWSEVRGPIRVTKLGNDQARETAIEFGIYVKAHL